MKSQSERTQIAESAITLLTKAIDVESKSSILEAYEMIEDESFSWDNLDVIFMEWNELVDKANDILYS